MYQGPHIVPASWGRSADVDNRRAHVVLAFGSVRPRVPLILAEPYPALKRVIEVARC